MSAPQPVGGQPVTLARYRHAGAVHYGHLQPDGTLRRLAGSPFDAVPAYADERDRLCEVRLLAPIEPGRVFGVGLNYVGHIRELKAKTPRIPMLFMKPQSAVVGPEDGIVYPAQGQEVHYEGELAVVIGKAARRLSEEDALGCVLGYTCANDVSERIIQREEMGQGGLLVGKGFDTFCPVGPVVVNGLDPAALRVRARVNGQARQDSSTADLLFNVRQLISYLSHAITLQPGDLILTGTPAGVGPLKPGDVVEVEVEGIGVLRNTVVAEEAGP